jgi:flagellar biosynthesis/type III secretory pathway protein FliH
VGGRLDPRVAAVLAEARRLRDGWRAAIAAAEAAARDREASRLRRRLAAVDRWAGQFRRRLREDAVTLAQALATRLVGEALHGDARRLLDAVATEAARLPPAPWMRLRLSPADADALRAAPLPPGVQVEADPALGPGDIVIEGPAGRVDARVATRVAACLPRR